jgi:putative transposase
VGAGAQTPPPVARAGPAALPPVRHEVVDPADPAQVAWLTGLFARGRADLYGQDEADLALLPTLTRTWMRRGEQLRVPAPGTNRKRSVSAATDLAAGALLWRTDDTRCADQFCAIGDACVARSAARGRLAVLLIDNAQAHRLGKTGIVRRWLTAQAGRVVLVFLPAYSPDLQPAERLWRQWRPNVTHNHTRATLAALEGDSDRWLGRIAAVPRAVLRALACPLTVQPSTRAA